MRYKKGSKVEVQCKSEVPSCFWRCAEIVCGNGHNYTVKYDMDPGAAGEAMVERVSRKSIRPCPPLLEVPENWVPGDVVEVFHNFAWKIATVSKLLERNYILVRLIGTSQEFKLSKFDLRVRQHWQDDKWFVIGKGTSNCEDGKYSASSTLKYNHKLTSQVKTLGTRINFIVKDEHFAAKNINNFQESPMVSSKTRKRGLPYHYAQVETPPRTGQKSRVIEKEGRRHRLFSANPSSLPEKCEQFICGHS